MLEVWQQCSFSNPTYIQQIDAEIERLQQLKEQVQLTIQSEEQLGGEEPEQQVPRKRAAKKSGRSKAAGKKVSNKEGGSKEVSTYEGSGGCKDARRQIDQDAGDSAHGRADGSNAEAGGWLL